MECLKKTLKPNNPLQTLEFDNIDNKSWIIHDFDIRSYEIGGC